LFSVIAAADGEFFRAEAAFSAEPRLAAVRACACLSLAFLLYLVGSQITSLAEDWPQFKQQVINSVADLQRWISTKFHIRIKQADDVLNSATSKLLETGSSVLGDVVVSFSSVLLTLVLSLSTHSFCCTTGG